MRTFTTMLTDLLSNPKLPVMFLKLYLKNPGFWNYAFICGLGVIINQTVLHFFVQYLPLWVANLLAIFIAWMWNYFNAIGFLAKYWGMKN